MREGWRTSVAPAGHSVAHAADQFWHARHNASAVKLPVSFPGWPVRLGQRCLDGLCRCHCPARGSGLPTAAVGSVAGDASGCLWGGRYRGLAGDAIIKLLQ